MNDQNSDSPSWHSTLGRKTYVQERLNPSLYAIDYIPLRDLAEVVRCFAEGVHGRVLDYGCGGSPYREIFERCISYIGADINPGPMVDILLAPDGTTNEPDSSFDAVLSTQVLEHVADPKRYLEEVFRLLKPGGKVLLTTHGMFLEHGCPYDFHRWTGYGLARLASEANLKVDHAFKITSGLRASVHLIHTAFEFYGTPSSKLLRLFLGILKRLYSRSMRPLLNFIATYSATPSYVDFESTDPVYVGVAVIARKPSASTP